MINLNSAGLDVKIFSSDTVDLLEGVSLEQLTYILSKYTVFTNNSIIDHDCDYIKIQYKLSILNLDDMLSDSNLTNSSKLLLSYQYILNFFKNGSIYIITKAKQPDKINVIFTQEINSDHISGQLVKNVITKTIINDELEVVYGISCNQVEFDIVDNELYSINNNYTLSRVGTFQSNSTNNRETLLLYDGPEITDSQYDAYINHQDFAYNMYIHSSDRKEYAKFNGFVYELKINNHYRYIQFAGSNENYFNKQEMLTILNTIETYLPNQIFSFKTKSYIAAVNITYNSNIDNNIHYHPLCDQNYKFTINTMYDFPSQFSNTGSPYDFYQYNELTNFSFTFKNKLLHDYMISIYNNDSSIITAPIDFENLKLNYINNIKVFNNSFTSQIEYYDLNSEYINENIGTPSDADYIDIHGFDEAFGGCIVVYISKLYESGGFQLRNYKISKGGVIPLNNDELIYKYDDSTIYYIDQLTSVDYLDNWQEQDKLSCYINNINWTFDSYYKLNNITLSNDAALYIDLKKYNNDNDITLTNAYLYKNSGKNILISNEQLQTDLINEHNILPYQLLSAVIRFDNVTGILQFLDIFFIRNTQSYTSYSFNNLYLSYIPIISYNSYYTFGESNNMSNMINESIFNEVKTDLKMTSLCKLYADSTIKNYDIKIVSDYINVENKQPITFNEYKNNLLSTLTTYDTYDTMSSNVCVNDELTSALLNKVVYKLNVTDYTDSLFMFFYDIDDIINTDDKIIILNKVIGIDWITYQSLYSDEIDPSFSNFIFNALKGYNKLIIIMDFNNHVIKNLEVNNFEFDISDNDAPIIDREMLFDKLVYKFDKSEYNSLYDEYKKVFKFYTLPNLNIAYSTASFKNDENLLYDPLKNDILFIETVA